MDWAEMIDLAELSDLAEGLRLEEPQSVQRD